MIYYGIRRKKDGAFMPQGRARGFTHDYPTLEKPPRLFNTRGAANVALNCWLLGDWSETHHHSYGYPIEDDDVYPMPPAIHPLDRIADEMEIVLVEIKVHEQ